MDRIRQKLDYLLDLVRFAASNNPLLYLCLALALLSAAIEIAAMTVLMPIATAIAGETSGGTIVHKLFSQLGIQGSGKNLLTLFLALLALRVLSQFASQGLVIYLGRRLLLQLTTRAFSSIMWHVPVSDIEKRSIGYFITLAGDEASRASTIIVSMTQFVTTAALAALYFSAILAYSPMTAGLVVLFLAATFVCLFESFRYSHRLGVLQIEQSQTAGSVLLDALNGLRSVRSFGAEKFVTDSYFAQIRQYVRTLALIDLVNMTAKMAPALFLLVLVGGLMQAPGVSHGIDVSLPEVATIAILLMRFFPIVGQVLGLILRVVSDIQSGQDITRAMRQFEQAGTLMSASKNEGISSISLRNVDFEHVPGVPVLAQMNCLLEAGKSYAIVGGSGSGKSTLLDLVLGFYRPTGGSIEVNGRQLVDRELSERRGKIVLVSQDTAIFNDTVRRNLELGQRTTTEQLKCASAVACADQFIDELPNGFETWLSYRGGNLSGGQKQRIGIARGVLRQPDVLLLDESTSALDAKTRDAVVANLLREFANRIVVFVTHDEFVMSHVDEIIRLEPQKLTAPAAKSEQAEARASS